DSTPTHSYMKFIYRYPHAAFPYADLASENRRRGKGQPEYELVDTGVFNDSRYFDVVVEYAKADPEDILIVIHITNRGPEEAPIDVLPHVWFPHARSWYRNATRPSLSRVPGTETIMLQDQKYGTRYVHCDRAPALLFTENETNFERLFGSPSASRYVKDAFHRYVIEGERDAINPAEL